MNNSSPRVSIIIPTYNCAPYIAEAVNSVLMQTYGNIEVIVVDDGSIDDTADIMKKYRGEVKYIYQRNSGSSHARNVGIKEAKGAYIAFLDADDRWMPFKLELQVNILETMPDVDMLFTNYSTIDECGILVDRGCTERGFPIFSEYRLTLKELFPLRVTSRHLETKYAHLVLDSGVYYGNVFAKLFMGNFILPSTEMIRNKDGTPLLFNERIKCAVDQDYHLRFAREASIAYVDCDTAEYRINRVNKLSGKANTPQLILNTIASRLAILEEHQEFANKNKKLVRSVISKFYGRLAYYYISELNTRGARENAVRSLVWSDRHLWGWALLLMSLLPVPMLKIARMLKSRLREH